MLLIPLLISLACPSAFAVAPANATRHDLTASQLAVFEDACALFATSVLTGVTVGDQNKSRELCSTHPDKESCNMTRTFITQRRHGDDAGLKCVGLEGAKLSMAD